MATPSRKAGPLAVGFAAGYAALAIVGLLLFGLHAHDARTQRAAFMERAEVNARLVTGAAQSAVVFEDARAAAQAFSGLLDDPELSYVQILDTSGFVLAGHPVPGEHTVIPVVAGGESLHDGNRVHVSRVVRSLGGDVAGKVQVGFEDRRPRSTRHALSIASAVILLLLFAAWAAVHRTALARLRLREQLVHSERLASLGRLSASVAHEINNPLSFIRSNSVFTQASLEAIAAGDKELLAEVSEALVDTLDGVERVRRIVLDLKSYGRDEAETLVRADMRKIASRAVKMTGNQVRQRADLVVTLADDVSEVRVDEGRMVQVFVNLLVNAAQALPEADVTKHRIELRVFKQGKSVVAEVQDTGTGIPPDVLSRLFEPFFTTKPQGQGMGLGLYLCHSIVRSSAGAISAHNNPSRGCTFRIVLPEAPAPTAEEIAQRLQAQPPALTGPRRRVLVVDDEAGVVIAMKRDLGGLHDVTGVGSGASALDLLSRDAKFDVVLCDLMMPGISGVDVFERTKRLHPELARRFVFITGGAFTDQAREFLGRVTNRRIDKPLDTRTLHEAIVEAGASIPAPAQEISSAWSTQSFGTCETRKGS